MQLKINNKEYTMKTKILWLIPILSLLFTTTGCKDDDQNITFDAGKIVFHFLHYCDGNPLIYDSTMYTNEAGNVYQVNEIQYFISDVTLHKQDGGKVMLTKENDIYYIDTDIPSTHTWQVPDSIPVGNFNSVSFTFGISKQKNISFMFVNPPEMNMVWPEFLGGGYHYMKLNGRYIDSVSLVPFNFHMGIGQIYPPNSHNYDSIIEFVHNNFDVELPNSAFTIAKDQTIQFDIIMQVEEWFKDPHTWDHNIWGTATMENQAALQTMKENGYNVFKVGTIK
jgi:hypothetical protein